MNLSRLVFGTALILFGGVVMRLDKYLKVSRIIKRRTVANEACDAGRVLVNAKPARASYDVQPEDVIQLEFGGRVLKFRVVSTAEAIRKEDAALMYEMIDGGQ